MAATRIDKTAPGGKRKLLKEILPLRTPLVVQFFPAYACNFTCGYCHFSIPKADRPFLTSCNFMDYKLYVKCIDDLLEFKDKAKTLRFVGMGEPLLHKDIAAMVAYAKQKDVANTVEILTNGSLLTSERSDALIAANLDRLVVSLQGTSAKKYKEICGADIDFDLFLSNLEYFYKNKKNTHVYIKIVDCSLDGKEDELRFFEIFENICDSIGIEHAVPIFPGAEYNDRLNMKGTLISQFGLEVKRVDICPQPFYFIQANPDGNIVGCQSTPFPQYLGNCIQDSLLDIWNGHIYNDFRHRMLDGRGQVCEVCRDCNIMNLRIFPEDDISGDAERLKGCY